MTSLLSFADDPTTVISTRELWVFWNVRLWILYNCCPSDTNRETIESVKSPALLLTSRLQIVLRRHVIKNFRHSEELDWELIEKLDKCWINAYWQWLTTHYYLRLFQKFHKTHTYRNVRLYSNACAISLAPICESWYSSLTVFSPKSNKNTIFIATYELQWTII